MKRQIILFVLLLGFCSCEEENVASNCGVKNPIEDLTWLKETIEAREQTSTQFSKYEYIAQTVYKGNTVFIIGSCCPNCNTITPVLNCEGEKIGQLGNREEDIDRSIIHNKEVIWKPDDFVCNIN